MSEPITETPLVNAAAPEAQAEAENKELVSKVRNNNLDYKLT